MLCHELPTSSRQNCEKPKFPSLVAQRYAEYREDGLRTRVRHYQKQLEVTQPTRTPQNFHDQPLVAKFMAKKDHNATACLP